MYIYLHENEEVDLFKLITNTLDSLSARGSWESIKDILLINFKRISSFKGNYDDL